MTKHIVAAGTIKNGHTNMVMSFHPKEIGWEPRADPNAEPDYDLLRKQQIEEELAADDPF